MKHNMRKIFSIAATAFSTVVLMLSSCGKHIELTDGQGAEGGLVECSLSASVKLIPIETQDGTKVSINADGVTPNWEKGDRILVLDADMKPLGDDGIFTLESGDGTASASFTGKKYRKQTATYAIYPASAATMSGKNPITSGILPAGDGTIKNSIMLGQSDNGTSVVFNNACAVLKINTGDYGKSGGDPAIKSIGISASYGDTSAAIAGGFDIDWNTLTLSPNESLALTSLTISLPTELIGDNKDVLIPIFPLEVQNETKPSIQFVFTNSLNVPAILIHKFDDPIECNVIKNLKSKPPVRHVL